MMKKNGGISAEQEALRQIAEKKLQSKEQKEPDNLEEMGGESIKRMVHELQVHQIELEMQNEELQRIQSELDLSRKKYLDLYNGAPVGYLTLNEAGDIVEANQTTEDLLGTDRKNLINVSLTKFIMKEDQDVFYLHRRLVERTRTHQECELRMLGREGSPFWSLLSTLPKEEESGGLAYRVIISDISKRKRAEMELTSAKKKAVAANEAKSQFLANMSHEMRTPLNGIVGMAHLLTTTILSNEQKEFVSHIMTSSDTLLTVIGDVLDYSKIEAGEMQLENILYEPLEVLKDVVDEFTTSATQKGLEMKIIVEEDIPPITGDPFRFRQVLENLIGNAVKYTPSGEIRIILNQLDASDPSRGGLICSIEDTGIGIPSEKIHSIFDRFVQGDSSNTRRYGGTGLGLSISKGLVEVMGGEIWAKSCPGKGSCFTFTLTSKTTEGSEERPDRELKEKTEDHQGINLLLVEDNPISRILIDEIGKINQWNIVMATNGREAVEMYKANPFDAVLMDIHLPDFDGFEATGKIRNWEAGSGRYTPIIGITADAMEGTREKCIQAGMDDYLSKPIKPKALVGLIGKVVRKKPE
jgi:PAS domain S-box-containing protein